MFTMDGNNSLKRIRQVGSHAIADHQVFESDYFLAQENVDKYADEVKRKAPAEEPDEDVFETAQQDSEGDPTDGAQPGLTISCTDNWKASQAGEVQRMLVLRRLSQPTASSAEPAKIFNRANVTRLT